MESFIRTMIPKLDSLTTEMKSRIDAIPHNYLEENVYVTDHLLSLQSSLDWKKREDHIYHGMALSGILCECARNIMMAFGDASGIQAPKYAQIIFCTLSIR